MMNRSEPVLAIVVPCFNEEEVIQQTATQLKSVLDALISQKKIHPNSFILFSDDGSRDKTWEFINDLHVKHPSIKGIKLSNNSGHQNALFAGLVAVKDKADCVISIDADLQQDETAIPQFLEKFKYGADIVFGVRHDRGTDSFFKKSTALFFYKLMQVMGVKIIKNHADYRLMSQKAVRALADHREVNLFLRGLVGDLGFKTDTIFFDVKERFAGESKYSLRKLLSFAINGITSFSVVPLRLVAVLGVVIFAFSFVLSIYVLVSKLLFQNVVPGWASTVLPIYFIGGVQVMSIGIVGEYIGKIYKEVKARPRYLIETELHGE
jgi:glycosyltransferase involved in cell wall biosynthesis